LLHISEIKKLTDKKRIDTVEEVLNVGDKVQVEIKEIDQRGKLSLTPVLDKADKQDSAESSAEA
jgi:polyribonucleotide nucleotidyltransferase